MIDNIINNPIDCVLAVVNKMYPKLDVVIQFDSLKKEKCVGLTFFPDDNSTPHILIDAELPFYSVPEILAHELAHLIDRIENGVPETKRQGHRKSWKKIFNKIFDAYHEHIQEFTENNSKKYDKKVFE